MSQITPEEMQRRNMLLKKAKQMLTQEYAAIRTKQHQQWIVDSETSWRTNGVLMAYPPGKIYPTEQEIIEKALELYNISIAADALKVDLPENTTQVTDVEPVISEPVDVTSKLQDICTKASSVPIDIRLITEPVSEYIEKLTNPEPQPIETVVETKEEPTIEKAEPPESVESAPKHSLLRSVLSGWLQKNKDKET